MPNTLKDIWNSTKTAMIIAVLLLAWLDAMNEQGDLNPQDVRELTNREVVNG